jgi:predicted small secreted protein
MKRLIQSLASLAAALTLLITLQACNTTKGVGTDVGKAGDALKHSAERNGAQ